MDLANQLRDRSPAEVAGDFASHVKVDAGDEEMPHGELASNQFFKKPLILVVSFLILALRRTRAQNDETALLRFKPRIAG
jgi:hypothetical protein